MNKTKLEEIKQILLKEKERLEKELSGFSHRNPKSPTTDFNSEFPNIGDEEGENAA